MGIAFSALLTSIAYLIGSIPTGYLIARWKGIADIRTLGSGNIGATNVGRYLGLPYFFLILLLDSAKAYLCLYGIGTFGVSESVLYLCAVMLLVGNAHSLFLNFTGGKGVATGIGILACLDPGCLPIFIVSWIGILWWCKDVGIASVVSFWSSAGALAANYYFGFSSVPYSFVILLFVISGWITWRHWENLRLYFDGRSNPSINSRLR